MNARQQKLYQNLMALTSSGDTFYFQDFVLDESMYRVFNYRLSSYSDFLKPDAMECRGIMFEVQLDETQSQSDWIPIRLASRPMIKFFNLSENPMTMGLDLSKVDTVELKADGSLISTYIHNGQLRLKSKGSLFSEQALDAMKWVQSQPVFARDLYTATDCGWTVNLEWCSSANRIVIGYAEPHLKVLNARHTLTGKYQARAVLELEFGKHMIERVNTNELDTTAFVQSIPAMMDDIEGYVCRIGDLWFKVKTDKYKKLHMLADDVRSPRRLYEAVLNECIDDIFSLFTDPVIKRLATQCQEHVSKMHNSLVVQVETFCEQHKYLNRKEFALLGQHQLERHVFGLVMQKYTGKNIDYKEFMLKHYDIFQLPQSVDVIQPE